MGRNPPAFLDSVTPVVDVYDQYLAAGELRTLFDNTAPPLAGSFTRTFTVPTGKCWRVLGAGGFVVLNAADVALIAIGAVGIVAPNTPASAATVFAQYPPQNGVGSRVIGCSFRPPIFLPPGFAVTVTFGFSGAITIAGNAQAQILFQEFDT
jgi:hypothetical protein